MAPRPTSNASTKASTELSTEASPSVSSSGRLNQFVTKTYRPESGALHFLDLGIDSPALLSRLYMPAIVHGGIFIPSRSELPELGTRVCLILELTWARKQIATLARVIWLNLNPAENSGSLRRGYGLQLEAECETLQSAIDDLVVRARGERGEGGETNNQQTSQQTIQQKERRKGGTTTYPAVFTF